jgi:hypothetical protein
MIARRPSHSAPDQTEREHDTPAVVDERLDQKPCLVSAEGGTNHARIPRDPSLDGASQDCPNHHG